MSDKDKNDALAAAAVAYYTALAAAEAADAVYYAARDAYYNAARDADAQDLLRNVDADQVVPNEIPANQTVATSSFGSGLGLTAPNAISRTPGYQAP
jgi:hypothetical protein